MLKTTSFQCPEGLLLGRNMLTYLLDFVSSKGFSAPKGCCLVATCDFPHGKVGRYWGFSAPKGCCLVATTSLGVFVMVNHKFQCPEGLLLGRNAW